MKTYSNLIETLKYNNLPINDNTYKVLSNAITSLKGIIIWSELKKDDFKYTSDKEKAIRLSLDGAVVFWYDNMGQTLAVTYGEKIISNVFFQSINAIADMSHNIKYLDVNYINVHWNKYIEIINKRAELKSGATALIKPSYFAPKNKIRYSKAILSLYKNNTTFKMAIEKLVMKVNERLLYGNPVPSDFIFQKEVNKLIVSFSQLIRNENLSEYEFSVLLSTIRHFKEFFVTNGIAYTLPKIKLQNL